MAISGGKEFREAAARLIELAERMRDYDNFNCDHEETSIVPLQCEEQTLDSVLMCYFCERDEPIPHSWAVSPGVRMHFITTNAFHPDHLGTQATMTRIATTT